MNVRLLRKIQKHILEEPRRYDQNETLATGIQGYGAPPCGTVGCIAGWACVLTGKTTQARKRLGFMRAKKQLGLKPDEAMRLFAYTWNVEFGWPEKFRNAYDAARTPAGKARAAFKRIEHFIKTKGAE